MGWLFGFASAKDIRDQLNASRTKSLKLIDQAATSYGQRLWSVFETKEGKRFISLDLIKKQCFDGGIIWGYKDMTEDMGPCYYDCPIRLIIAAGPTEDPDASRWRDAVVKYNEKKKQVFSPGEMIDLYGQRYEVLGMVAKSLKVRRVSNGCVYKITPSQIPHCAKVDRPS